MCYSASTIARYINEESKGGKTSLQLNKLTYIAHGWSLAIHNRPLIVDDIQAWEYGPVVPVLYYQFEKYAGEVVPVVQVEDVKSISSDDKALLDKVIDVYGKYSGMELSAMTHQDGTPWSMVWKRGTKKIIPNDIIKSYYINKAKVTSSGC